MAENRTLCNTLIMRKLENCKRAFLFYSFFIAQGQYFCIVTVYESGASIREKMVVSKAGE